MMANVRRRWISAASFPGAPLIAGADVEVAVSSGIKGALLRVYGRG